MSRDDEQVWAELVESFNTPADDEARAWPAAENVDPDLGDDSSEHGDGSDSVDTTAPVGSAGGADVGAARPSESAPDPEEHFVPPSPPPLPSTDVITRLAWVGALGTPVVFTGAALLGASISGWAATIGAAAFIGGFALLITRLKGHDPYDPDDGAVV